MKIIHRDFVGNGPGSVTMEAEDSDDLWYAYNLIAPNDTVMAVTFRKVQREISGGGRDSERVRVKLEVQVEEVDYDKDGTQIGAFHTLELDLKRSFVLRKENWDSLALDTLKQASDPAASADLAVVLMQEGLANIFLVGRIATSSVARIETSIPRKHGAAIAGYESALKKFFENVLYAFFHKYLLLEAERRQLRPIIENKSRIILVHANSGYRHSLGEVLHAPNVMNMIKDTKAAKEVKALNDFFTMLSNDPARACYGPKHVELFRNSDVKTRKNYVNLVESVRDSGGDAFIFSSMHVSGEQLAQLTGIAALLRFPLPDLEDIEM
ncbi:hypothetical protein AALP_AA2G219500 [Arabis alpina]|uniref:eRF1/Pelota-like N-terminal domain-containing protein n=1 Tax=Arabis alpina TaxID=50452 RepID=A0A087HJ62_ARAAL|nr:hypothetical protein AALP_AA2G219500 [Arabis alpina]